MGPERGSAPRSGTELLPAGWSRNSTTEFIIRRVAARGADVAGVSAEPPGHYARTGSQGPLDSWRESKTSRLGRGAFLALEIAQRAVAEQNDFLIGDQAFHFGIVREDFILLRTGGPRAGDGF